jgi:glycosyltransferase involved in cell wall biosynthesis
MSSSEHKKSILVVTSTFPRWLNDTDPPFVMELSKRLVKTGIEVDVLAPHAFKAEKKEIMDGINVYRYQYFFSKWQLLAYDGGIIGNLKKNKLLYLLIPLFMFSQMWTQLTLIKKNKYDLIHAHWLIPQGFISVLISKYLYKGGPKILCTSHGSDLFSFQSFSFDNIKKWVLNYSDGITVVSEHMRKNCLQITDIEEKINVCSMGVDLVNTFVPLANIKRDNNRILFVGRLVEEKNVTILLEAMHSIIQKYPRLKLIIVGDGPERCQLEALCKELSIEHAVEFLGALNHNQLPEIYSSSSIAVMTSKREGLGLVAIEAMGCGCVVIAPSLPAMEDIIENGVNGVLVKPGDSAEVANAIEKLLVDSEIKDRIAARARQSVIEKFDWEVIVNEYREIIESICKKAQSN